ncbi:hypothetical protein ACE0DR_25505 [Azotobacter sp. CWF10]
MYRGILGDCFLLRHEEDGQPRHILIDCGVLQGVKGARERMKLIVDDIHYTTGGNLDLVVVTHEHHDHLSGFSYEKSRFFESNDFDIQELWLAWTEDPNDPQASALRQRFSKVKSALTKVLQLSPLAVSDPRLGSVRGLSAFIEPLSLGGTHKTTIDLLKEKAGRRGTRYLEPGDVVRPERLATLKAMVLGPPRSEQRLRKDAPSKSAGKEVYLTDPDEAFAIEDRARRELGETPLIGELPFARPYQRTIADARAVSTGPYAGAEPLYFDDANQWRCIEGEWLDGAEAMALKMDSDTNNTSLVLAFELPDRQVLLFPGDAQVGNWLSWGDQTYPRQASAEYPTPATRDDILARVSLYKVGHHCSHNATLREFGLGKMICPRLVAMIPVVESVAQQNEWKMPFPDLLHALLERAQGRVVSGDGDPDKERDAFTSHPSDEHYPATVKHAGDGLWVELRIPYEKCRHI